MSAIGGVEFMPRPSGCIADYRHGPRSDCKRPLVKSPVCRQAFETGQCRSFPDMYARESAMTERETMEYDVVVVGGGPAGLSFAIRLKQLQPETSVCVIEKASTIGAQILSGAVIEPGPLDALLRARRAWLAPMAEALGVDVFPGFAAADNIYNEDGSVAGVRIGDMGVAKDGTNKPGYTQGIDIKAKVTVLAEGARGSLTKQLIKRFALDKDSDPQGYSIGIKELWQVAAGRVTPGK